MQSNWNCNAFQKVSHFPSCFVVSWCQVLITTATLCAGETSDGLYASVHVRSGQQQSSEEYKAIYDFEAQVSRRSNQSSGFSYASKIVP